MEFEKYLSNILVLILVISAVAGTGCIGGGEPSTTTITKTEPVTPTETLSPSTESEGNIGEPVRATFSDYEGTKTVEVTVLEYIRGEDANQMIKDANMFNDEPKPGNEYLLVKVRVKYVSGPSELSVSPTYFKAFANGVGREYAWVVMPDSTPKLDSVELVQGGVIEGWIAFEVPEDTIVYLKYYYNIFEDPIVSIMIPAN